MVDELAAAQAAAGGNLEAVLTVDARTAAFNDGVGGGGGGAGGENGGNGGGGRDGGAPPPSSPATATTRWLRPVPRLLVGKTVRRLKVAKPPKAADDDAAPAAAAADGEKEDGEQREQGEHGKEEDRGEPPRPVLTFATTLKVATRPTVAAPGGLAPRARVTSVLL